VPPGPYREDIALDQEGDRDGPGGSGRRTAHAPMCEAAENQVTPSVKDYIGDTAGVAGESIIPTT